MDIALERWPTLVASKLAAALLVGATLAACGGEQPPAGHTAARSVQASDGATLVVSVVSLDFRITPPASLPSGTHAVLLRLQVTAGSGGYDVSIADFRLEDSAGPVLIGGGGPGRPATYQHLAWPLGHACLSSSASTPSSHTSGGASIPAPMMSPTVNGGAVEQTPLARLMGGQPYSLDLCFGVAGPVTQPLTLLWSTGSFASTVPVASVALSAG